MPQDPNTDNVFFDALRGEDALGAVVRAHIHIETRLNLLLDALTPHPEYLPSLRYERRVKLAVALGLDVRIQAALLKLGYIRNAFSHKIDVTLTDDMVNDLFAAFPEIDQRHIISAYNATNAQLKLGWPPYEHAHPRNKFIVLATAFDKFLIEAEEEIRQKLVTVGGHHV